MGDTVTTHQAARTLEETVHYPEHEKRRATDLYKASHSKLIYELDLPCHICGVRNSTLHDPSQNRYGAKQMETHHYYIEDSLANAIDVKKFNALLLPHLKIRHPEKYTHDFTQEELVLWVHGDEHNLMVLCNNCHRSKNRGIHELTYPIWSVQDLIFDNYDLTGFVASSKKEADELNSLPATTGKAKYTRSGS